MRKIIFCNISMKEDMIPLVYQSEDPSLAVSQEPVAYPLLCALGGYLKPEDSVKIVLLCKCDPGNRYLRNLERFQQEFQERCGGIGCEVTYTLLNTAYAEEHGAAEKLLRDIVDACEPGAEIVGDITYGVKSLPILLLAALAFAMKHLGCRVERLFYAQVYFQEDKPTNPRLCDLSYLLYLNSLIYTLQCDSPEKAKRTLEMLLSF